MLNKVTSGFTSNTLLIPSTTTAGQAIQSALARALDDGKFALMANLNLSSAFDMVNVNLLIQTETTS